MSDFTEQSAAPLPVMIGGKEYLFAPLRYRDHAEAARRMRGEWASPAAAVRRIGRHLRPEQQRLLLEIAYRDERRGATVELDDVWRWYRTPAGALFHKWLMLRRHHPELSLDDVDELLSRASAGEAIELTEAAEEADGVPWGNSASPPATAAGQPTSRGGACSRG